MHKSNFILLIHQLGMDLVGKYPSYSDLKSSECLFRHWLSMKRFFFILGRTLHNQFKFNYPRNQKALLKISLHFWNLQRFFEHFQERWASEPKYFQIYGLKRKLFFKFWKHPLSENRSAVRVLSSPKHSWNLQERMFICFSSFWDELSRKMSLLVRCGK